MTSPLYVTISSQRPPIAITALRGQTAGVITSGFGTWSTVDRPRRKGLTEWAGEKPLEVSFSMLFDGYAAGRSIEADLLLLERLASPAADGEDPPTVRVSSGIPHAELDWVISGLTFDPAPIVALTGDRLRQEVTIALLERVAPDFVASPSQQAVAKAASATGGHTYLVRAGDTLLTIAAKQLGDFTRWQAIASLNGLRDPNRINVGQRLRLP